MFDLRLVNKSGNTMPAIRNQYMTLTSVEELHGVDNEFATSTSPYFDGDYVDHIRTSPRTISLTYALRPPIADSLKYFNSMVKSKQNATLIETREDGTEISIEGIVTVPPYTRWSDNTSVQVQLYCSKPYWRDLNTIVQDISAVFDLHEFQLDNGGLAFPEEGVEFGEYDSSMKKGFINNGDIEVGMTIEIVALGTVVNPKISLVGSSDFIGVNTTLNQGDFIIINTERGNKSVQRNGDDNKLVEVYDEVVYSGEDWLQLPTGYNELSVTAENENSNMYFNIYYKQGWQ